MAVSINFSYRWLYYMGTGELANLYNKGAGNEVLKCALLTSSYTPSNSELLAYSTSETSTEIAANGYTTGGNVVQSTIIDNPALTGSMLWLGDVQWPSSTITARYAFVYNHTLPAKYAVCLIDFGENKTSVDGTFKIDFDNINGVLNMVFYS